MEKTEKLSFKEWFEHIWYYYKWMIILGGTVVIFLIGGTIQILQSHKPDVNLLYVGKSTITVNRTIKIESKLKTMIEDYNNDGVKEIEYMELTALAAETSGIVFNADANADILKRFETEVRVGDSVIYLLNEYYYNRLVELKVLAKLSDVMYEKDIPQTAIDEYGVYLKDLEIYKTPEFSGFPDTTIICIRHSPEKDQLTYGMTAEIYTANKMCFNKIMTYSSENN